MAFSYNVDIRNARLELVRDAIDAGETDPGTITIYSGTRPATGAAITDQIALAVGTFGDPCAPDPEDGLLTFAAIDYGEAIGTGTATWARIQDGDDGFAADADVGMAGSGADVIINSTGIVEFGAVTHVSASITAGNP